MNDYPKLMGTLMWKNKFYLSKRVEKRTEIVGNSPVMVEIYHNQRGKNSIRTEKPIDMGY